MLWVLIRIASLKQSAEAILMSTHNICFYGQLTNIILQLSSNILLMCSSVHSNRAQPREQFGRKSLLKLANFSLIWSEGEVEMYRIYKEI